MNHDKEVTHDEEEETYEEEDEEDEEEETYEEDEEEDEEEETYEEEDEEEEHKNLILSTLSEEEKQFQLFMNYISKSWGSDVFIYSKLYMDGKYVSSTSFIYSLYNVMIKERDLYGKIFELALEDHVTDLPEYHNEVKKISLMRFSKERQNELLKKFKTNLKYKLVVKNNQTYKTKLLKYKQFNIHINSDGDAFIYHSKDNTEHIYLNNRLQLAANKILEEFKKKDIIVISVNLYHGMSGHSNIILFYKDIDSWKYTIYEPHGSKIHSNVINFANAFVKKLHPIKYQALTVRDGLQGILKDRDQGFCNLITMMWCYIFLRLRLSTPDYKVTDYNHFLHNYIPTSEYIFNFIFKFGVHFYKYMYPNIPASEIKFEEPQTDITDILKFEKTLGYTKRLENASCDENTDCISGYCYKGFCKNASTLYGSKCKKTEDCPIGVCNSKKKCVKPGYKGYPCNDIHPCSENYDCINGTCEEKNMVNIEPFGECKDDVDCPNGFCYNNRCMPFSYNEGEDCTMNRQCIGENMKCKNNKCFTLKLVNSNCDENEDCISGWCHNGKCTKSKDIGSNCISDNECVSGICHDGVCSTRRFKRSRSEDDDDDDQPSLKQTKHSNDVDFSGLLQNPNDVDFSGLLQNPNDVDFSLLQNPNYDSSNYPNYVDFSLLQNPNYDSSNDDFLF
jgi:hypothetical protein